MYRKLKQKTKDNFGAVLGIVLGVGTSLFIVVLGTETTKKLLNLFANITPDFLLKAIPQDSMGFALKSTLIGLSGTIAKNFSVSAAQLLTFLNFDQQRELALKFRDFLVMTLIGSTLFNKHPKAGYISESVCGAAGMGDNCLLTLDAAQELARNVGIGAVYIAASEEGSKIGTELMSNGFSHKLLEQGSVGRAIDKSIVFSSALANIAHEQLLPKIAQDGLSVLERNVKLFNIQASSAIGAGLNRVDAAIQRLEDNTATRAASCRPRLIGS